MHLLSACGVIFPFKCRRYAPMHFFIYFCYFCYFLPKYRVYAPMFFFVFFSVTLGRHYGRVLGELPY